MTGEFELVVGSAGSGSGCFCATGGNGRSCRCTIRVWPSFWSMSRPPNLSTRKIIRTWREKRDVNIARFYIYRHPFFGSGADVNFDARIVWILFQYAETRPGVSPFYNSRELPPTPRLQVDPSVDLDQIRQSQNELLNSYGWADQATGKVRVPIDRAMDMLIERKLPVAHDHAWLNERRSRGEGEATMSWQSWIQKRITLVSVLFGAFLLFAASGAGGRIFLCKILGANQKS